MCSCQIFKKTKLSIQQDSKKTTRIVLVKQLFKSLIPPVILQALNQAMGRNIQWIGDYKSWKEASIQSKGYDPDIYLNKLIETTRVVRDDESKCERDSVLFDKITYPYPLLSNLFSIIARFESKSLFVLDFGGSLGSVYFQNRKFLRMLPSFTWNVLEQDKIIEVGKKNFQTSELLFHSGFEEALSHIKPQDTKILILSSVLQYLENPYQVLQSLIDTFDFDAIIIDRTPFSTDKNHHITIQKVPQKIYPTQYPCHLFSKDELLAFMNSKQYCLFDEFESYCDNSEKQINFLGFSFFKEK